jgi:hypothetical protein
VPYDAWSGSATQHGGIPPARLRCVADFIDVHLDMPLGVEDLASVASCATVWTDWPRRNLR